MEEQDSRSFLRLGEWRQADSSAHRDSPPSPSDAQELTQLHRAKERFKNFVSQIGELTETPVREDVLSYCQGGRKSEKCLQGAVRVEALLRKIEVRIEKMLKTKRLKRNWGEEDLKILIWVVSKYADLRSMTDLQKDLTGQDWKFIASLIPGVTAQACMFKWLSIKKITLATHNWTRQESDLLAGIVKERLVCLEGPPRKTSNGNQIREWKEISQELYRANMDPAKVFRNAKQCREHWTCYLSPQLKKGPWQLYQDVKLLKFIRDNKGLKKWSQIARNFQGRTQNALKNRYTLIIQKQKRLPRNKNKTELTLISEYLEKCYVDQFTAHVKVEPDQDHDSLYAHPHSQALPQSIYREDSSPGDERLPAVKREETHTDTTESVITPVRVQKFSINDFQAMNFNFFRHIQPGVIKSDGTFTKIALSPEAPLTNSATSTPQSSRGKEGPFSILPLHP